MIKKISIYFHSKITVCKANSNEILAKKSNPLKLMTFFFTFGPFSFSIACILIKIILTATTLRKLIQSQICYFSYFINLVIPHVSAMRYSDSIIVISVLGFLIIIYTDIITIALHRLLTKKQTHEIEQKIIVKVCGKP